ncbi:MAG: M20/M25/M40 family metallo-hydrolase, partial [Armatimonadetes bacterium]|nr:M20/M25/M40 family metallo-hydrolase [Armatimonadota bacterium]
MVQPKRVRQTFLDLVHLNSPPDEEREVRRYCREVLREAGFVCQEDAAGNLIAQRSGPVHTAPRIFFAAHMDTVQPTEGIVVREEGGVFRTDGRTILGADDKAALCEILEGVLILSERKLPHGDLQVVFTVGEEVGLRGAKALAPEVLAGSLGFVLDASGPVGSIITAAPSHEMVEATFTGRAAHAGFEPEAGISALQAAAIAVARMQLGRIDAETTANIGVLQGGTANNIIPETATLRGEARSHDEDRLRTQVEHMRACLEEGARAVGASVDVRTQRIYSAYRLAETDPAPALAARAWTRCGPPVR